MDGESIKYHVAKKYQKIRLQTYTTNFFKSCISEGFLPKGLNVNFNLAMDVNDQELVTKIEQIQMVMFPTNLIKLSTNTTLCIHLIWGTI